MHTTKPVTGVDQGVAPRRIRTTRRAGPFIKAWKELCAEDRVAASDGEKRRARNLRKKRGW